MQKGNLFSAEKSLLDYCLSHFLLWYPNIHIFTSKLQIHANKVELQLIEIPKEHF